MMMFNKIKSLGFALYVSAFFATAASATLYRWSETAATNANADSTINWAEGQSPSSVNDSARAMMAAIAKYRDDISGRAVSGGTATAYTMTSSQGYVSLSGMHGAQIAVRFHATNNGGATFNLDGLGAAALQLASGSPVTTGSILANSVWDLTYDNTIPAWLVHGVPGALPASFITTNYIADGAVSYSKLQNISTDQRILGRYTYGAGVPQEITVSTGLTLSSTGRLSAPAVPVPAAFKNLSIKVASNTTVTVAADFVSMADSTSSNFLTAACSGTADLGSNGSVNKLDTGTIGSNTWYSVWCIATAAGTTGTLVSSSFTVPTLPSGYTYRARIGAVRTIAASATLYGTWQFGRRAQYVVGLAQTSVLPVMASGITGTCGVGTYTAVAVGNYVPPTASEIEVIAGNGYNGAGLSGVCVAPNNAYGTDLSANLPPLATDTTARNTKSGWLLLESTSIYFASSAGGGMVGAKGWVDNL